MILEALEGHGLPAKIAGRELLQQTMEFTDHIRENDEIIIRRQQILFETCRIVHTE
jgi:hypothetical protein